MLELGAQGWSELVDELVALAAQEGLGLRFARLEDDDRLAGLAVIGDVEVVERDIGLFEALEDCIEAARRVAHLDGDDLVDMALVAGLLELGERAVRVRQHEADDAEFSAVAGEHGVDVDVCCGEHCRHLAQSAFRVFSEYRNLIEHRVVIPFLNVE